MGGIKERQEVRKNKELSITRKREKIWRRNMEGRNKCWEGTKENLSIYLSVHGGGGGALVTSQSLSGGDESATPEREVVGGERSGGSRNSLLTFKIMGGKVRDLSSANLECRNKLIHRSLSARNFGSIMAALFNSCLRSAPSFSLLFIYIFFFWFGFTSPPPI